MLLYFINSLGMKINSINGMLKTLDDLSETLIMKPKKISADKSDIWHLED